MNFLKGSVRSVLSQPAGGGAACQAPALACPQPSAARRPHASGARSEAPGSSASEEKLPSYPDWGLQSVPRTHFTPKSSLSVPGHAPAFPERRTVGGRVLRVMAVGSPTPGVRP